LTIEEKEDHEGNEMF